MRDLSRAGSQEDGAALQEGWGLGRPRRPAAPRNLDAFHLASAAAEAARPRGLSTAPSRGGRGRRARTAAAPDHPHLPAPRAPRPWLGPAGRTRLAGAGERVQALARSPPQCSRPAPQREPTARAAIRGGICPWQLRPRSGWPPSLAGSHLRSALKNRTLDVRSSPYRDPEATEASSPPPRGFYTNRN